MSKLIAFVKRYQFWIICSSVAVVMLVSSIMLSSSLSKARKEKETKISGLITQITNIQSVTAETDDAQVKAHPNSTSFEGMNSRIKDAQDEAYKAWLDRWKQQEPLFVWPKHIIRDEKTYENLKKQPIPESITLDLPADKKADDKTESVSSDLTPQEIRARDLNDATLRIFGNNIKDRLPELAEIIQANWKFGKEKDKKAESAALGGREPGETAKQDVGGVKIDTDVVKWRSDDQSRWYKLVTEFNNPNSVNNQPTMMQALYIQQDLWLLEALFNIIKTVNGDADANDLAIVKKIDHIFFGRDAIGFQGTLTPPDSSLENPNPPKPPKRPKKRDSNNDDKFDESDSDDPCHGRFVDENFAPLPSKVVRDAVSSSELIDNAALTVAKRIPLRVAVIMDERKIPDFLAACANSPFRFEIRQVRINRHKPGESSGKLDADMASGLGGGMGGKLAAAADNAASRDDEEEGRPDQGDDGGNQMPSMKSGGAAGSSAGGAKGVKRVVANRTDFNVKVEFYGIVKIYNPVNESLFATTAKEQN